MRTSLAIGATVLLGAACQKPVPKEKNESEPPAKTSMIMASPVAMAMKPMAPATKPMAPALATLPTKPLLPADAAERLARTGKVTFPSKWSGKVTVKQRGQVRMLYLRRDDIIHTRIDMRKPAELISPYQQCLMLSFGFFARPGQLESAVVIGLGGGALTRFFHIKRPDLQFDSVDIDPIVVAVARKFFLVKETKTYRSHAMDGRKFLQDSERKFDLIILDAFDAEANLPKQLASVEFFTLVKERLTPGGVVASNFLRHSHHIYAAVYKTFKKVFPRVYRFPMFNFKSHNVVLIASRDAGRTPSIPELRSRIPGVLGHLGVNFPLERYLSVVGSDKMRHLATARLIHDPK